MNGFLHIRQINECRMTKNHVGSSASAVGSISLEAWLGVCVYSCVYMCVATALIMLPATANAQFTSVPPPPVPQLLVTPLVGLVGEARTLSVIGQWPNTCPPVAATLDDSLLQAAKTIFIRVLVLQTSVPCPSGVTPYRFEFPYAGREVGVVNVLIVTGAPALNGKGAVATAASAVTPTATTPGVALGRSAGDISGAWYDPATSGSGLSFTHAYANSDAVFGTWFLYGSDGAPRWFSIQEAKWSAGVGGTLMEAKLFETGAAANSCPPNIAACPTNSTSLTVAGRIRATFVNIEVGSTKSPQAKVEAFSTTDAPLFSSNIIRAF